MLLPIMLVLSFLLIGCGKNGGYGTNPGNNPPPPPGNTASHPVSIGDFSFSPSTITVAAGDTVTWTNNGNVGHTVTSTSGNELGSSILSHGQTYQHVFHTAGSFPYHCTVHPSMTGTVTVQ